jgi:hypothetical protein
MHVGDESCLYMYPSSNCPPFSAQNLKHSPFPQKFLLTFRLIKRLKIRREQCQQKQFCTGKPVPGPGAWFAFIKPNKLQFTT